MASGDVVVDFVGTPGDLSVRTRPSGSTSVNEYEVVLGGSESRTVNNISRTLIRRVILTADTHNNLPNPKDSEVSRNKQYRVVITEV